MNTTAPLTVSPAQIASSSSSSQGLRPGTVAITRDGRTFVWAKNSAGPALIPGSLVQSAAQVAGVQNLAPADTAVGARVVRITAGSPFTENGYEGGWMIVSGGPGIGHQYAVRSHPAGPTPLDVNLDPDDTIRVALTTAASKVDFVANPYSGVITTPAAATGACVGVAVFPIATNEWGWVQTGGVGAVLMEGTPAVGQALSTGAGAGGAAINSGTLPIIGISMVTGVAGRVQAVRLLLG